MKLFYLHIPKTGGQTLAMRIATAFPIGRSDIISNDLIYPEGVEELKCLIEKNDFIERHIAGPVLKDVHNIDILTTIRDPVTQIVSTYLHIRRESSNFLNRAASLLSPREFFAEYGDFLANNQLCYLVNSLVVRAVEDPLHFYSRFLWYALDRIRWAVPMEYIDEFITLWSIETGRSIPNTSIMMNVASKDVDYEELLDIVRSQPHLYSMDLLLWQAARERFINYKEKVLRSVIHWKEPNNTSRALWSGADGIWLRSGWYPPQINTVSGNVWWAGPKRFSEIVYSRKKGERYLGFSVIVFCGISHSDILAVKDDKLRILPMTVSKINDNLCRYWIDLKGLPLRGSLYLWVPEVWSAMMVDKESQDITRRSFATSEWRLSSLILDKGDM